MKYHIQPRMFITQGENNANIWIHNNSCVYSNAASSLAVTRTPVLDVKSFVLWYNDYARSSIQRLMNMRLANYKYNAQIRDDYLWYEKGIEYTGKNHSVCYIYPKLPYTKHIKNPRKRS